MNNELELSATGQLKNETKISTMDPLSDSRYGLPLKVFAYQVTIIETANSIDFDFPNRSTMMNTRIQQFQHMHVWGSMAIFQASHEGTIKHQPRYHQDRDGESTLS